MVALRLLELWQHAEFQLHKLLLGLGVTDNRHNHGSNQGMKATIFFIAMLLAAYLYDEGYGSIALFLAGIALAEGVIVPWRRERRRNRKKRQRFRRERDGVAKGDYAKMEPGTARLWHGLRYGSDD